MRPKERSSTVETSSETNTSNDDAQEPAASERQSSVKFWILVAIASAVILGSGIIERLISPTLVDERVFSTINITVESVRITFCFWIFGVRWLTRKFGMDMRSLFVAGVFYSVGILSLLRLLSFPGMPSMTGPEESFQHALYLGIFSRLTIGVLMSASVLITYDRPASERDAGLTVLFFSIYTAIIALLVLLPGTPLPTIFVQGETGPPLRIALEYAAMAMIYVAAIGYLWLAHGKKEQRFTEVALGLLLIMQAGFAYSDVESGFDITFLFGRIVSFVGLFLIFLAIVTTSLSRPYQKLATATDQLKDTKKEIDQKTADLRLLAQDLTERRLVETALRKSEKSYRQLVETANEGVWKLDEEGRTTFVNPRMAQMLGYSQDEMMGKPLGVFVEPSFAESALAGIERKKEGISETVEFELTRKDGSRIYASSGTSPIFDEDGEFLGALAIVTDITERKRAENVLRESERTLFTFLNEIPVGIVVTDNEGNHLFANTTAKKITGRDLDAEIGVGDIPQYYEAYVAGTDEPYPNDRAPIFRALNGDASSVDDVEIRRKNGRVRLLVSGVPIRDLEGRIQYAISAFQDITEQKENEEKISRLNENLRFQADHLEAVNAQLEAFSYSVSHDLRAPLRSIDGFSNILLEEYASAVDEKGRDYLNRIRSNVQRMGQLIDDLLKLSIISREELRKERVDLSAIARDVVAELAKAQPGREVKVIIGEGIFINGDAHLYGILLTNLLENAWKFTMKAPQPVIEFGVTALKGERVLFVRDNGAGFDMRYADKLFVPFQRLHHASDFPGMGIGLATAQRIVHKHGGRIWVEAEPGKGATIYFTEGRAE